MLLSELNAFFQWWKDPNHFKLCLFSIFFRVLRFHSEDALFSKNLDESNKQITNAFLDRSKKLERFSSPQLCLSTFNLKGRNCIKVETTTTTTTTAATTTTTTLKEHFDVQETRMSKVFHKSFICFKADIIAASRPTSANFRIILALPGVQSPTTTKKTSMWVVTNTLVICCV